MIEARMKDIHPQTSHGLGWDAKLVSIPAKGWIDRGLPSRVLHVFPHACNLINDEGEILSLVSEQAGQAPFAVVLDTGTIAGWGHTGFQSRVDLRFGVSFKENLLLVSGYPISITDAEVWDPRIDLEGLNKTRMSFSESLPRMMAILNSPSFSGSCAGILGHVVPDGIYTAMLAVGDLSDSLLSAMIQPARSLCRGLAGGDLILSHESVRRLAGLGPGLTPAGDDFIMGAFLGLHFFGHQGGDSQFLTGIVEELDGRTNALSMAFLRCAARGEASIAWHDLHDALVSGSGSKLMGVCHRILRTGHSSGADALAGFIALTAWLEWRNQND